MAVKIRLQRHGRTKAPYYHIVVATATAPRDGRFIERLGYYNPTKVPAQIDINVDKAVEWLDKGAQPTDTVRAILRYKGVLYKKHLMRGVSKGAFDLETAENKFQEWLKSHENAVIDHVKTLEEKKAKQKEEETAKYEAKRQDRIEAEQKALAAVEAEATADAEASNAVVEETAAVETVTEEASVEEAPATEAKAEEAAPAIEEAPADDAAAEEPSKRKIRVQAIQLAEAGTVIRTHGVDGTIHLQSEHIIKELSSGEALFLWFRGEKVPYFVVESRQTIDQTWLVKLEGVEDREFARIFVNHPFWVKESLLEIVERETGWNGWLLCDAEGTTIGEVINSTDMGEYLLLTVQYGKTEVLVPLHDSMLVSLQEEEKHIWIQIPDGLLNLED